MRPERVYLRVPILVRGSDETRGLFSEVTSTINISRQGALISVRSSPRPGSLLEITDLSTQRMASFVVAFLGQPQDDGSRQCGVQIQDSSIDIWGIKFEDRPLSHESLVAGLLMCLECGQRVFGYLSQTEYNGLSKDFNFQRFCDYCEAVTKWTVGLVEETAASSTKLQTTEDGPSKQLEGTPQLPFSERRRATRYALKVPLLVTSPKGSQETTATENISSTGLMFSSSIRLEVGDLVQVIIGQDIAEIPAVKMCRVVRRMARAGTTRFEYGVKFEPAG